MNTEKMYLMGDSPTKASAVVGEVGESDGRPWVRLDRTVFHPQGGGQKSDRGWISGAEVVHVAKGAEGGISHYLSGNEVFVPGQAVSMAVDAEWRAINSRYHSGGHLIAALIEECFADLTAVAGHHWPAEARVEFRSAANMPAAPLVEEVLTRELHRAVLSAATTHVIGDPYTSRSIRLGSYPAVPCGGTHVRNLSELSDVEVVKVRFKSGKMRVSYKLRD